MTKVINFLFRSLLIKAVNGGLVMVAFYPHFVSCGEKATIKDVVGEHNEFDSIISLAALWLSLYYRASYSVLLDTSQFNPRKSYKNFCLFNPREGENMQMSLSYSKCVECFYLSLFA